MYELLEEFAKTMFTGGAVINVPEDLREVCMQLKEYYSDLDIWKRKADSLQRRLQ